MPASIFFSILGSTMSPVFNLPFSAFLFFFCSLPLCCPNCICQSCDISWRDDQGWTIGFFLYAYITAVLNLAILCVCIYQLYIAIRYAEKRVVWDLRMNVLVGCSLGCLCAFQPFEFSLSLFFFLALFSFLPRSHCHLRYLSPSSPLLALFLTFSL